MLRNNTSLNNLEEISTNVNQILYTINYKNILIPNFENIISHSFKKIKSNIMLYIKKESIFDIKKKEPVLYDLLFEIDLICSIYCYNFDTKQKQSINITKDAKPLFILLNEELDKIYNTKHKNTKHKTKI